MVLSRKNKVSLVIALIAAAAALGSAAIEGLFSGSGNGTSIVQNGNSNNACSSNSRCNQG
jgi:hypothetical protein